VRRYRTNRGELGGAIISRSAVGQSLDSTHLRLVIAADLPDPQATIAVQAQQVVAQHHELDHDALFYTVSAGPAGGIRQG